MLLKREQCPDKKYNIIVQVTTIELFLSERGQKFSGKGKFSVYLYLSFFAIIENSFGA